MVGVHVFAGRGEETLTAAASALCQLLFAGGVAEIGGGAANIVDIALEIFIYYHQLRFGKNAFMAAGLNNTALVEGQCAERASAKTTTIADQAELDFFDSRHATGFFVAGMPSAAVGKIINCIHFGGGQRLLGRILQILRGRRLVLPRSNVRSHHSVCIFLRFVLIQPR